MADPVKMSTKIDSPLDTVLAVILDFDSYPDWQKEVTATEVHTRDDQGRPAEVEVSYQVANPETGKAVYKNYQRFSNEAGQTFQRQSGAEIAKLMGTK